MIREIDPRVARTAAEQLALIDEAGWSRHFDEELLSRTAGDAETRMRLADAWKNPLKRMRLDRFAERLAGILDCPLEQARAVVIDLFCDTRRQVALQLLEETVREIRRAEAVARGQQRRSLCRA